MKTILFRYIQNYNFRVDSRVIYPVAAICLIFLVPLTAYGKQTEWSSPLKECWSFDIPSASRIQPASDNENIFIATAKGSIIALDQHTGSITWEADLGGNLWTEIRAVYDRLFTTAFFGSTESDQKAVFRQINPGTGIPFWQLEEKTATPFNPLISDPDFATLVSDDGVLLRVNRTGDVTWRQNYNAFITTNLVEVGRQMIFGTSEKTIVFVDSISGNVVFQTNTRGIPTYIIGNGSGEIYAGDKSGRIDAFRKTELIPFWTTKTGAAITKIAFYQGDLIVSSNDNFVYRISSENGNKVWKRKLAGRIIGSTLIDSDYSVYLTTGSTIAVILSLEDGSLVNKIDFGKPFVSGPVKINGGFAATTDSAITAVSNGNCSK